MNQQVDLILLDWGVGGLSVYNEIKKLLPKVSILYVSDSGQKPYGKMSSIELKNRLKFLLNYLSQKYNCQNIVVACNAASTSLLSLQNFFKKNNLKVTGVIEHAVNLIKENNFNKVAVIGGRRTILSKNFTEPRINKKNLKIKGRIAQPLSAVIEKGQINTVQTYNLLTEILMPLKNYHALVLACTHYPAASHVIQKIMPKTHLLDPAIKTAQYVKTHYKFTKRSKAKSLFLTSGNVKQFKKSAYLAFGVKVARVEKL